MNVRRLLVPGCILAVTFAAAVWAGHAPPGVRSQPDVAEAAPAAQARWEPPVAQEGTLAPAQAQAEITASRTTAIVQAARRVAPSVVSVNITRHEAVQPRTFFEGFFLPPGTQREVQGLGSGVIIRADGLILTNEHVVRGADRVVVTLPDGRQFRGKVLGVDEVTDLALIRIDGRDLPVAPLGDSDSLMIGEWVVAIGNPFGYLLSNTEPTVTAGVVSGVDRNIIGGGQGSGEDRGYYLDMVQTDAAINPGNSGGALVNALGQVVGINSSILSQSGGSEGLGFAIPINRARRIVGDLLAYGHVRRAWIGLEVEEPAERAWGEPRYVRISHVAPGSPAAAAGLKEGMIVSAVGGRPVRTALDWEARVLDARVGEPLVIAAGATPPGAAFTVVPRDLPSMTAERVRALSDFEFVTVTPSIQAERGLASPRGALIVDLSENARDIGLQEGDVVVQINRYPVEKADDAAALLRRFAGRGPIRMVIERDGQLMSISFYVG